MVRLFVLPWILGAALVWARVGSAQEPPSSPIISWATSQAHDLTEQGQREVQTGHLDSATRRFLDALALDGTYGPAYLALASLHERLGDMREAERVYDTGLERLYGFWEAYVARARLRHRLGRYTDAVFDLREAIRLRSQDLSLWEELARWQVQAARWPEALAVYRQLTALSEMRGDVQGAKQLRRTLRGLGSLAAELDPLRSGERNRRSTRYSIEAATRRLGLLRSVQHLL